MPRKNKRAPIHIKESRKGSFTTAAKSHGMSDAAFASDVLSHPDNFSSSMDKKAEFARNAEKWHH
jgi:hypothetical protein